MKPYSTGGPEVRFLSGTYNSVGRTMWTFIAEFSDPSPSHKYNRRRVDEYELMLVCRSAGFAGSDSRLRRDLWRGQTR